MDIATGLGIFFGGVVLVALILMGGDLGMFADSHAAIVIFGGAAAATLIRFPLTSIMHGLPLGMKFAFTMRRWTARELVDEIARLAEVARKAGPIGLEKEEVEDPFLAKGIRFVADGYDQDFIRDNLERDRDNFLTHLDEGQKLYRAIGDCAPAFGMVGTLIGMVQMFANMTDPSKLGPYMAVALLGDVLRRRARQPVLSADRRQAAAQAPRRGDQSHLDHRRHPDDPRGQEPDAGARDAARLSAREASSRRRGRGGGGAGLTAARHADQRRNRAWRRKKRGGDHGGGGHGWFVTFADLMGLLVAFFVMLVAFSTQDAAKLQVVAGSMRDAFGVQNNIRYSGLIEVDGLPTRPRLKNAARVTPEEASATPTPDEGGRNHHFGTKLDSDSAFALAAASLRQALQDMPEIAEMSKHIMIEETKQGLNIEIVDQNGSSMFPEGSKEPYERTRRVVQRLAVQFKGMPNRMSIAGHTSASRRPSQAGLRAVGFVGGPRQCRPPHSGRGGRADAAASPWWRAAPTPSRCSPTIPSLPPTAASQSP